MEEDLGCICRYEWEFGVLISSTMSGHQDASDNDSVGERGGASLA